MKNLTLRQAIKALGFTIVKWHDNYNYRSVFASKDDKLYNIFTGDLRLRFRVVYREVEDINDHIGKQNMSFTELAERNNIKIYENRKKCDYNY